MPSEFKDKISDDDKKVIEDAVKDARKVLENESSDKEAYETAARELSEKIMPIGAKLYQSANDSGTDAKDAASSDDSASDDAVEGEVVDK